MGRYKEERPLRIKADKIMVMKLRKIMPGNTDREKTKGLSPLLDVIDEMLHGKKKK